MLTLEVLKHIGRLSPDVRQKYLEYLFQSYGCCTVNLKDGYGFAVYDSNDAAARAMRALRGKLVCGERITVNWSKQQPRFPQGFRRSSRVAESSHGRTFRDREGNVRSRDSVTEKDHPASHNQSRSPDAAPEKESDQLTEDINDAKENIDGDLEKVEADAGGTNDANAIEHDRWDETGKGTLDGDSDDFDRYEPYHGYDWQEEVGNVIKASPYDSRDHGHSSDKWQEHYDKRADSRYDKPKSPPTCYKCGTEGHIARYCPQEIDGRFRARRDGLNFREKWELRQRRFGPPLRSRPEFYVDQMDQTHYRVQDGSKPFPKRNRREPRLSNVPRESIRYAHCNENMPEASKETHKRSRSERSRRSSLYSEPSRYSHLNTKDFQSNRNSSDSGSRSPRSRSRFRSHSQSHSAHSSSKSSQPTQQEELRSNINHPVTSSVPASPKDKSPDAVENKNLEDLMENNLDRITGSEVKNNDHNKHEGKGSALNSEMQVTPLNLNAHSNGESFEPSKGANVAGYTRNNLDKSLVDDYVDNVAGGVQRQIANFEGTSSAKSKQDFLRKNGRSKSLKLTTNEVISAMKHYGMEAQEGDSRGQSVETFLVLHACGLGKSFTIDGLKRVRYLQRIMLSDLSRTKNMVLWISMSEAAVVGGSVTRLSEGHLVAAGRHEYALYTCRCILRSTRFHSGSL
ncbi:hypothetical protein ACP4OV_006480 [Aristida adscensionis]